ncbi:MAG: thiamine pyrophosphate-binding protein [Hydrogenophilaceae bacterium]|jgi:acetolactate synthase-1/2/3 large subunit|nr:thiamine pyrophosphate-binding protein [Hydrogenophilaceae bacterium]
MAKSGAQLLVDVLAAQGVARVFCVPGESYLAVLDALYAARDAIETIVCRHEAGAANMAEAAGKLTGRPGICFVTRGPGATHAAIGVHTARQDSTPMILFVGQVARGDKHREAFQELDYSAVFGSIAKWAVEIEDAARIPEFVERAFATAMQGRMGPVVIALPEDMLSDAVEAAPGARVEPARSAPSEAFLRDAQLLLASAEKPVLIVGGSGWDAAGRAALERFAANADLPVVASFRRKDLLDNEHPNFAGDLGLGPNPKLIARIKEADLVLAVGARLGENPSQGYTLFTRAETAAKLVHVHPCAEEVGRVWPARAGACADSGLAMAALAQLPVAPRWGVWRQAAREEYEAFSAPVAVGGAVNLSEIVAHLSAALPADAIIANGAGNFAAWLHRFHKHRAWPTQLAPTSGAMGYGFPAAIAAKLTHPDRTVICFAGDGDFMMTANEMATIARHKVGVVTIVIDNSSYGTIRMHQEREFPARVHATDLVNPDFVAFANAFGVWGVKVARTADFAPALREACARAPALIHVIADVENIAPGRTISALRGG